MPPITTDVTEIVIVDDHLVIREGLRSLIEKEPDFKVIGEAGTVSEAVDVVLELKPDLVLMDYGLPDGSGVDATRAILAAQPDVNIVFLTVHETDDELFSAIRSGAKGYLLKNIPASEMLQKLRGLASGEAPLTPELSGRILAEMARKQPLGSSSAAAFDHLTTRELEVLREIMNGATNQEIADCLHISVNTVKNHVHNILKKLELKSRREAALLAERHGLSRSTPY